MAIAIMLYPAITLIGIALDSREGFTNGVMICLGVYVGLVLLIVIRLATQEPEDIRKNKDK